MSSRNRSETIGQLGRVSARRGGNQPKTPAPAPSSKPPKRKEPPPDIVAKRPRRTVSQWVTSAFVDNLGLKLLSAILALTVFLLINTDREREITTRVGVSYSLPSDRVLVSERLADVKVTIRGPARRLRRFDERELDRLNLDLRNVTTSDVILTKDMVTVPTGLTVTSILPRSVHIAFDKKMEKKIDVKPNVDQPAHGFALAEIKVEPSTVLVRGPESALRKLQSIATREISLADRHEPFSLDLELLPPEGVEIEGSSRVNVRVRIEAQLSTQKIATVTVAVVAEGVDAGKVKLSQSMVDITLTGPLLDVERSRELLRAKIVITSADIGKSRDAVIEIDNVPDGVGIRVAPATIRATVRR
jgi:YbbR domain-containing protein